MTKEFILTCISEEQIYDTWLSPIFGETPKIGKLYSAPYRPDKTPSFRLYRASHGDDSIMWHDFGRKLSGNCFKLVAILSGCEYKDVFELIARSERLVKPIECNTREVSENRKTTSQLCYKALDYTLKTTEYWNKLKITVNDLRKFDVLPIYEVHRDGNVLCRWKESNPIFGYRVRDFTTGNTHIKFYKPFDRHYKWLCNAPSTVIYGLEVLLRELTNDRGDIGFDKRVKQNILFLTKSMKDVIVLYKAGYKAVCLNSESTTFTKQHIAAVMQWWEYYKQYYPTVEAQDLRLMTLYDNDEQGYEMAYTIKNVYYLDCVFLTGAKDPAELVEKFSYEELNRQIEEKLNLLKV
jgi:hypothetical protein